MTSSIGLAGRLAHAFIGSKLTPLFIVASILLGIGAVALLPREEEPQIVVPMIDVIVHMSGSSAREVEERVTRPMEKLLWEIPGVEYIYSTSSYGQSLAIVRFRVGENEEASIVRLNQKLAANVDLIPPGASLPIVKPRSIDDVPILALTLSSDRYSHYELRRMAAILLDQIKEIPDVSEVRITGGLRREIRITPDPARMASLGIAPSMILAAIRQSNVEFHSGQISTTNREILVRTGALLRNADDVRSVVVQARPGSVISIRDVAEVTDGPEEPENYMFFSSGASDRTDPAVNEAAVTISVAKRKGTNAIVLANQILEKVGGWRERWIPTGVRITTTRNYGETAARKSNELLYHMMLAVISVTILVLLTLGARESGIVALAIPVTLALTLAVFFLYGYTLNRVTLFALIFSIGILVDDAIVVVENIVRHRHLPENAGAAIRDVAIRAVNEVGNPTILATFAVVAAILPMAMVRGLMGPYMMPIPVGASAAMLFSLIVAFVVTPWAAVRFLGGSHVTPEAEGRMTRLYRQVMTPLIRNSRARSAFLGTVVLLLLGAVSLFALRIVRVKMLPFDNKSEFQIIIDMPEGTTLEQTAAATAEVARTVSGRPEVRDVQSYVGTASPYNFNGLVRHYFMRAGSNVADIQVNLTPPEERSTQSHQIALQVRESVAPIAARWNANVKVAEVPPGPPVLQTLVAEVYGPDYAGQIELARQVREIFLRTPGVVDVDWYVEDPQPEARINIDRQKSALHGVHPSAIASTLRLALSGENAGLAHIEEEKEDVPIVLRLERALRSDLSALTSIREASTAGRLVPISELVTIAERNASPSIYHKNLMPVVYVTGDVAGAEESPVYAILKLNSELDKLTAPDGGPIPRYVASQPSSTETPAIKWDGEWHITYEVFRDLGLAFAAVLVLIYILITGWFQSFTLPLVIMSAIPFSLVGIIPAHSLMGAFFTATSMIGFIAGAGIVVRNSIILVDFIEMRVREGLPIEDAVIEAGAVRFRPMLLTASAVVVGAGVILFDPIFQGLALSLMAGEVASLLLSRMTVPVLYYLHSRRG